MITATRLDGVTILINPMNIEIVESTPDTMITLMNGKKIIVKESLDFLREEFLKYQRFINRNIIEKKEISS